MHVQYTCVYPVRSSTRRRVHVRVHDAILYSVQRCDSRSNRVYVLHSNPAMDDHYPEHVSPGQILYKKTYEAEVIGADGVPRTIFSETHHRYGRRYIPVELPSLRPTINHHHYPPAETTTVVCIRDEKKPPAVVAAPPANDVVQLIPIRESYAGCIVFSCMVFWFCGLLFGGIAFILAGKCETLYRGVLFVYGVG